MQAWNLTVFLAITLSHAGLEGATATAKPVTTEEAAATEVQVEQVLAALADVGNKHTAKCVETFGPTKLAVQGGEDGTLGFSGADSLFAGLFGSPSKTEPKPGSTCLLSALSEWTVAVEGLQKGRFFILTFGEKGFSQ